MKFYADAHIHKEVIRQLQSKGVDIIHCADVDMKDAADPEHLEYATEHERIVITCDRDFEDHHVEWQMMQREHAGIVYFPMDDGCKQIGHIVNELMFLVEAASYQKDLYNQFWRSVRG